jgi:indolepyruvate ferredoxin oxidoreductase
VLVGAAFQAGLLPFDVAALTEAVRLNGVDVDASLAALAWGRAAVAQPDVVAAALSPVPDGTTGTTGARGAAPPSRRAVPADLAPDADWLASLAQVVQRRVAELIDFQNARVARDYLARVRDVARQERATTNDPAWPVTETFARGLYALTATKDEYEVARLHLLDEEQEAFAKSFPGARRVYLLKPPLLASLGLRRKIKLVRTARPAFRALRAGRKLRGTPLDPFGWSSERREERQFLVEYLEWVGRALALLTPANVDAVRAIVNAANDVHGYAHVRQSSMAKVRTDVAQRFAALTGSAQRQPSYPIAG